MKYLSWLIVWLLCYTPMLAQKSFEQMGGVYYAYHQPKAAWHLPEGYTPFYLVHYGRHGSRWMTSDSRYEYIIHAFDNNSNLTPLGKKMKAQLHKVWRNARGNGGLLTPVGETQQRQLATRIYKAWPQVFATPATVTARSSVVRRCQQSMNAFCDKLQKLCRKAISQRADSADMQWIAYASPEQKQLEASTQVPFPVNPRRFMASLFVLPDSVKESARLMGEMHTLAASMQDVGLKLNFYPLFTTDEYERIYQKNNRSMTLCNTVTPYNYGIPARSAVSLWRQIMADADSAIATGGQGASLLFGHDTSLYRLLTLLQWNHGTGDADQQADCMDEVVPMAANVQLVFCHDKADSVWVALLHNEQPITLKGNYTRTHEPMYRWSEVKREVERYIAELQSLYRLQHINTMVGTSNASTASAGVFGKGSEEHGQTLPGILVPNGQNTWTPQTRHSEQKCVAPYYYSDYLWQGFRNSHWIVGGCTQDYGSFTITATTHNYADSTFFRGAPFRHSNEVSHPNYYSVVLPEEHLKADITALSHTAMLRFMSSTSPVTTVVIASNNDFGESEFTVDTLRHMVYGVNPVHRIYQGWGKRAGFNGCMAVYYGARQPLNIIKESNRVCLMFSTAPSDTLQLVAASSFTNTSDAANNMMCETHNLKSTFSEMMTEAQQQWLNRLATISVVDDDTAAVNQFYGSLYRTSFLPRERSNCDGSYPMFARGTRLSGKGNTRYGDYSMWDIYRAELPLYNIIDTMRAARFTQSLVDMAHEGGWLPIFPCWNSYTAAMIGDHCSAAIADACVKGIKGVDYSEAYRYMRQNATVMPARREYQDGMGRRALSSYLKYGFIPLEDSVPDAFHTKEQTSRTLEYAYDDFAVAQVAGYLGLKNDSLLFARRSENWRNVINPHTGMADGRHNNGRWAGCTDVTHRQRFITEGTIAHYTYYVPQNIEGLIKLKGGRQAFVSSLDTLFSQHLYWHGNEPCHHIAYLYALAGRPDKTRETVNEILKSEYNDTPGGLSGNDDAGQMSAWYVFSAMGFYPVCPGKAEYVWSEPHFKRIKVGNLQILRTGYQGKGAKLVRIVRNGEPYSSVTLPHQDIVKGATYEFVYQKPNLLKR